MFLKIKEGRTKFMEVTLNPTNTNCLKAGNHTFGKLSEFKYLGTSANINDSQYRNSL
jgi:catalase (peroxidase I)